MAFGSITIPHAQSNSYKHGSIHRLEMLEFEIFLHPFVFMETAVPERGRHPPGSQTMLLSLGSPECSAGIKYL